MNSEVSILKEVHESHSTATGCDISSSYAENDRSFQPRKAVSFLGLKPKVSSISNVHELFQCPICCDPMYPPILQCQNGHTLCSKCKNRVHNRCPTCRQELNNIRCLALERIAQSLELPCKHRSLGCHGIFPYYDKLRHETRCRFRPYNCPYAGAACHVTGDIPTLVQHLMAEHTVDMHAGCTFNHRYVKDNPFEIENATWMLTVFNCFSRYFCLHFEAILMGTAPVYAAFVRFMGEPDEAKGFRYSLEVGGSGRRLVWEGIPRSIRDNHWRVRDNQDALYIPRDLALFFSGDEQKELKLRLQEEYGKITEDKHFSSLCFMDKVIRQKLD